MGEGQTSVWQPIETAPEGEHILLWFPHGERGIGGMECATIYRQGLWSGGVENLENWSFWTHGGPNAGSDWSPEELPTHWMPLPEPPHAE